MKEHEDLLMPRVQKSTVIVDTTAVDEIVAERLDDGEGKTEMILAERDEGEDMMVDVVGADVDDNHGCTGVDLDSKQGSNEECMRKETETHDLVMEDVAGSGEDCDASVGIRVLTTEKETDILDTSKIAESSVAAANLGSQEVDTVVVEESFANKDENVEGVSVDPSLVSVNNQCSSIDVVNVGTCEVDVRSKEESLHPTFKVITDDAQEFETVGGEKALIDSTELPEKSLAEEVKEQPVDCDQKVTDGDHAVTEKTGKENEALDSIKISEPSITMNHGSEDVDVVVVDEVLANKDDVQDDVSVGPHVHAENQDERAEVDKLTKAESFNPTIEAITKDTQKAENGTVVEGDSKLAVESSSGEPQFKGETALIDKPETERGLTKDEGLTNIEGLTKDEEILEQTTESVQKLAYGDGVMGDKTGKGDEIVDLSNIPESLITVNLAPEEVITGKNKGQDYDSVCVKPSNDQLLFNSGDEVHAVRISNSKDEVPNTAEPNGFHVSEDDFEKHCDLPRDSEFSYEDTNMDAGVDIDEVLGWNDETPGINTNSEADVEHGLLESSSEPVLIGHREENIKSREPIVYERRVHVEVPLYDTLNGSQSPVLEDENLKIETDSEKDDDESVQDDEQKVFDDDSFSLNQTCYFKPPKREGRFSVSDLVWGKVRSHPWWPGQIIDPSDASEKAMKYHKKDCFLVAYFGDRTFAWNDPAVLKPFRANFSQIEKQTNLEMFKIAVDCALEEVARRVELGLACSCVPNNIYKQIEYQDIENSGVRKESSRRYGADKSARVNSFEPDKLVDYVRLLARVPHEGDKMELTMAKAQLSSYGRYKGHRQLAEFQFMLEDPTDGEKLLSDLTDDGDGDVAEGFNIPITSNLVSSSGYKKRKARDSISDGPIKRPHLHPTPKPSFKVGAVIQRVASQLTGPSPPSVHKSNSDTMVDHGQHVDQDSHKQGSVAEMLSQLHLTAQDPMKGYPFLHTIIPFFYDRRAAVFSKSLRQKDPPVISRKRKPSNEKDPEEEFEFEFDDVNDSYWTDRIVQNHSEDQVLQDNQNGGIEYEIVEYKPKRGRPRSSKKRVFKSDHEEEVFKEESEVVKKRRENLATEVVMKFTEGIYFPSEIQINKMFRRFGPLMESETEVDRQGGRARVVFKKCCDAEVAHSSAGKFNIFGSINVNYELNYTPLVSYKPLPLPLSMDAS